MVKGSALHIHHRCLLLADSPQIEVGIAFVRKDCMYTFTDET